jgi:uncharacterized protein YbcI
MESFTWEILGKKLHGVFSDVSLDTNERMIILTLEK